MEALSIAPGWEIPSSELSARFERSGGPGGQNVNKVSTKVVLRFALSSTAHLSPQQARRLAERYPSHLTSKRDFQVVCDETRSQPSNLERARERLREMLISIRTPPKPRRPTSPTRGQKRRRLEDKRRRSLVKRQRGSHFD